MKLEEARPIGERVKDILSPHCDKIKIVGSIRRGKAFVHDIDMVAIPKPETELLLNTVLCSIGTVENITVDIYLATPATWATLLLIRTGSAESNIRLSGLAKSKGWHLKASGEGLFDEDDNRIAGDTEESIFSALGIPYLEPNERG